jgi:hypothetical protein
MILSPGIVARTIVNQRLFLAGGIWWVKNQSVNTDSCGLPAGKAVAGIVTLLAGSPTTPTTIYQCGWMGNVG